METTTWHEAFLYFYRLWHRFFDALSTTSNRNRHAPLGRLLPEGPPGGTEEETEKEDEVGAPEDSHGGHGPVPAVGAILARFADDETDEGRVMCE